MSMDWRKWAYEKLLATPALLAVVPEAFIFGDGSLVGSPSERPFIVLAFGGDTAELNDGDAPAVTSRSLSIWVHDTPGSYERIDNVLGFIRNSLVGQVASPGATGCFWQGDSSDLADDNYGTIVRNSSFRLVGGP